MTGILNLLTVLATLLNLTTGCGLRAGGNGGQSLLRLGQALARGRLTAGGSRGALASAMGAALQGGSGSRLLGGLSSLHTESLSGTLVSGAGGLGSGNANAGLQAGLGALQARLRGGSGGDLVVGIGQLAATGLRGGASSTVIGSGSSLGVSGQPLQQGLLQSSQMATGYLVAAGSASSTATGISAHLRGNPVANTLGAITNQGGGAHLDVVSSGGSTPGAGAVSPGGSPLQGMGQGIHPMGQAISAASHMTSNTVTQTAASFGVQNAGNAGTNPRGVIQSPVGGSPIAGATSGSSGPASNGISAGLGRGQGGLGAFSTGGTRGNLLGVPTIAAPGRNQGPGIVQGMQQTSQLVDGGVLQAAGAVATVAGGMGANLVRNTISTTQGGVTGLGGGVPFGDSSNGGSGIGSSEIQSGLRRGPGPQGAVDGAGAVGNLQEHGALPASGPHLARPSTGTPVSGTGILAGQVLGQGTRQIGQGFLGETIERSRATLQPTAAMTTRMAERSTTTLFNAASNVAGVSGGVAPVGSMGEGPSGSVSGQGLGQRTNQIDQALGGGIIGRAGATLQSTAAMTTQMAGSSATRLLNAASNVGGVPGGVAPAVGVGPGTGNTFVQALGPEAPQAGQPSEGTFIGSGGAAHLSMTTTGTELSGRFPGGSPIQGPIQGAPTMSQVPGGRSHVTVSASSHSSSTWQAQAHVIRSSAGNPIGGVPTLGSNSQGGGPPTIASGFGSTGTGSGTNLLGTMVTASTGGRSVGGPANVPGPSVAGVISNGATVSGSSSTISGSTQQGHLHQRRKMDGATAAAISLGAVASALTLGALGVGIASAVQSRGMGGGRTGGCPGRGCGGGCGRKRRSISQSMVPEEVLNSIPTDFSRLY